MTGRRSGLALLVLTLSLSLVAPNALAARADLGRQAAADHIVVFRPEVQRPLQQTRALERARGFVATREFQLIRGFAARLTPAQLTALRGHPSVAFIDVERTFRAAGSESLLDGERAPTGVRRIAAMADGHVRGPSGINVAVLDTGIDLGHRDLNAVHGKNCVGSAPAWDDKGHGTAVAGTIAARNNGHGTVGVAPGTRLVAVKVLDSDLVGTTSSLLCGIEWVTSTLTDTDPSNDILVANMSLFGRGPPVQDCAITEDVLHRAICASTAAGVTYVVSAGNTWGPFDRPDRENVLPAAYPEVLTATAMADSDGRPGGAGPTPKCKDGELDDHAAHFSSWAYTEAGAAHTIAAPGVCIRAILPGGYYRVGFGTTQTAPHVAGAVALCINVGGTSGPCAGLTPAEIIQKMRADAEAWTTAHPEFGFVGDPSRPNGIRYYGYLVRVGVEPPPGGAAQAPARVTIKKGIKLGGGARRLAADDDSYLEMRSTTRTTRATAWIARFANVPRDSGSLTLTYSGLYSLGCRQVISLRDFSSSAWIAIDSRVVGDQEMLFQLPVPGPASRFISGSSATGEVKARVRCTSTAGTFYSGTDLLQLSFSGP